ncbi:hypothetical protein JWG39_06955 [Desulforhopalus vacuolatus]|uniref:rubredoxin-like domain-containing protein n=1 Tax=Desulforhopalus vacuolatus TaxID=40414 RepID=UPI0019641B33|nr:DUF2231 domain-containing protein [Desulforhopalus vacuolatus]MBM9519557.1 hypothetical protein [Desulforhopalus vacuolatus]
MKRWICGVCGYVHEGETPPENCPLCNAPASDFTEEALAKSQQEEVPSEAAIKVEQSPDSEISPPEVKEGSGEQKTTEKWLCPVCGYVHDGLEPPETCPVCHVEGERFVASAKGPVAETQSNTESKGSKRWRCTVCQYECTSDFPPEKCPVCGASREAFVEIDAEGNVIGVEPVQEEEKKGGFYDALCRFFVKNHIHPISAHFPNGIMPAAVLFLLIGLFSGSAVLEDAAWYNLVVILVSLPLVLFAGFIEWKRSYRGAKTWIFITKITCGIVVLLSVSGLVIWPLVKESEEWGSVVLFGLELPAHQLYVALACIGLCAVAIAGHLGGKLVYGARQRR